MTNRILKLEKQGCNPCTMVQNFLDDKGIKVEKVDVFENPEIAGKYDIGTVPVTILLDSEGNEIARSNGYNPPELEVLISQL